MQKDLACSQLPQSEPHGRVRVQLTVCFSVGGKAAHVLDAGGKQICSEAETYLPLQKYILYSLKG